MAKQKKVRVDMRKNRSKPPRRRQWTRGFQEHGFKEEATALDERVRAKGDLSRRRTIITNEDAGAADAGHEAIDMPSVESASCLPGRVLNANGMWSEVEAEDGRRYRCTVRRLLRTLATDGRNAITTGDRVWFRPSLGVEGSIEQVEPRHGMLIRASRGREHVIVANVDQVVIVVSLIDPELKPHLIDRYLASAEQGGIAPIVCLNKSDLVDPAHVQPLIGMYSQLGIVAFLTSIVTGFGIDRLREKLRGRTTVFSGQSGVGKSSLLNIIQPDLAIRVREVSETTRKGKHTTTTAQLIKLELGGWVVDTPGIRQFQLWNIIPEEMEGFFPEFRPFVPLCAFPDCTHTHESRCAIKRAVRRGQIADQRYKSYLGLFEGSTEEASS